MNCPHCSTDAPAEPDPQSGRLRCPECRAILGTETTQPAAVRQAREILNKWSKSNLLDQMSSVLQLPVLTEPSRSTSPVQDAPEAASLNPDKEKQTPLSILATGTAMESQSADSQDGASSTASSETENNGVFVSGDSGQRKQKNRRHLTRASMKRGSVGSEPETTRKFEQQSETPQEGMDAVEKKLRVDRPVSPLPVSPAEQCAFDGPRLQDSPATQRFHSNRTEGLTELTDSGGQVRGYRPPRQQYIDESHEATGVRGPHFEVVSPPRSGLTSLTGQFLAYVGVLGLTIGTAIVIYGHFGGEAGYTPTGWLITTVAQMLLFLGVINLVSGGIEQNNEDVSRRINVLGEQLTRIEQVAESAMRGPKIPVERYSEEATTEGISVSEVVYTDER